MLPLLRPHKDIVEIRPKGEGRCRRYDVVLYRVGGRYVLHRVLRVRPADYVIVGDHNIRPEYGVTDAHILGVMTRVIRDGRELGMDQWRYRLYVHLWCDLFPLRAAILYLKTLVKKAARKAAALIRRR